MFLCSTAITRATFIASKKQVTKESLLATPYVLTT